MRSNSGHYIAVPVRSHWGENLNRGARSAEDCTDSKKLADESLSAFVAADLGNKAMFKNSQTSPY